jgi:hypothetical protein
MKSDLRLMSTLPSRLNRLDPTGGTNFEAGKIPGRKRLEQESIY